MHISQDKDGNEIRRSECPIGPKKDEGIEMNISDHVQQEVSRAKLKFPDWPTDPLHAVAIIAEEFGELQKAVLEHIYELHKGVSNDDIRQEAIQTAAMCHRFIESIDDYDITPSHMHKQESK